MNLRAYYQKIRETEELLDGDHIVVVSLATSEGGKPGVRTEAPKSIAAKLIAEGRARVASEKEKADFLEARRADLERYEDEQAARRMQVVVMPSSDPRLPKERK